MGVLDIAQLRDHLDEDVLSLVDARWDEWSDKTPTYCFDCSKYLKNDAKGEYKHCSCGCSTCVVCKIHEEQHLVAGVHPEQVDHQIQELASNKGWKKSPGCYTLVSRKSGCDEMQCSCKTVFCYRCGKELLDHRPCRCRARDIELEDHAVGPARIRQRALPLEQAQQLRRQVETQGGQSQSRLSCNDEIGKTGKMRRCIWVVLMVVVWVGLFLGSLVLMSKRH